MAKTPKSLLITKTSDNKTIIHPKYQLFKHRLEIIWFKDMKVVHGTHHEFYRTIADSVKKEGLLFPLVLDKNLLLLNGNHRLKTIRQFGNGTLAYIAQKREEGNFLARTNVRGWEIHNEKGFIEDFQFMFEGKMRKYTDKVLHLFTEGMRRLPAKR